jgi:hypothetical protein
MSGKPDVAPRRARDLESARRLASAGVAKKVAIQSAGAVSAAGVVVDDRACATPPASSRLAKLTKSSARAFSMNMYTSSKSAVASGARTSARALGAPRARASPRTTAAAMNTESTANAHAANRRVVVVVVVLARVIVTASTSAGVPRTRDANRRFRTKRRNQQVTPNA